MIEIQGLSIFYGKRKLAYPDISVKKGEAVGIAGKSGCGKNITVFVSFGRASGQCLFL